jgi:hypothetical protein
MLAVGEETYTAVSLVVKQLKGGDLTRTAITVHTGSNYTVNIALAVSLNEMNNPSKQRAFNGTWSPSGVGRSQEETVCTVR